MVRLKKAKELNEGSYVLVDEVPCKIRNIKRSAPGKHGHVKIRIKAKGVLDEKNRVMVKPGDEDIKVPIIEKKTAQVLSSRGESAKLMDSESYETFESKIPEDLKGKIEEGGEVIYWDIEGKRVIRKVK